VLRKVPGWYVYAVDGGTWNPNVTKPLDAAAERKKLDSSIAEEEKQSRKFFDDLKKPAEPK